MTTAPIQDLDRDTPAGLLRAMGAAREDARQAEIRLMLDALAWADLHSTDSLDRAMTVPGTDHELAIAGEGAPLVAEFAVAELATALGRSADSTRIWLGTVLELRHRLPLVWARIVSGPLEPFKARQIASQTLTLPPDAAAWVDAQVAPVAHKIGPARLERLVTDAIRRFDPEQAHADELAAAEHRHVSVHDRDVTGGCAGLSASLDVVDARDFETAIGRAAHALLLAGSEESLGVRRALAVGEIARRELGLDLTTGEITTGGSTATLYVHLDAAEREVAQVEHGSGDYMVGSDRLQSWLTRPGTTVSIRPVIDLNTEITSSGYQPSVTLREQIVLRNQVCVFPHCTRSARSADLDHIDPYEHGGTTTSANLAPLCRLHHRVKTHAGWGYTQLSPGKFLWRSPHHQTFHVDPTGTTGVSSLAALAPQPPEPAPRPPG